MLNQEAEVNESRLLEQKGHPEQGATPKCTITEPLIETKISSPKVIKDKRAKGVR